MAAEKSLADVTKHLQSIEVTDELVLDTLDGFNPILNSSEARKSLEGVSAFVDVMSTVIFGIEEGIQGLLSIFSKNKLQEEENRREMVEVLEDIADNTVQPPLIPGKPELATKDGNKGALGGFFDGMIGGLTALIPPTLLKSFTGMFMGVSSVLGTILKFGANVLKIAKPLGIITTVLIGLYGAIKGGIEGWEKDGVAGAITGAITGGISILLEDLLGLFGDITAGIFKFFGANDAAGAISTYFEKQFKNLYQYIEGFVDIIVGLFTLDSKRFIGGFSKMKDGLWNFLGTFFTTAKTIITDLFPKIWDGIKTFFLEKLPAFVEEIAIWWDTEGKDQFKAFMNKLGGFFSDVFDALWNWIAESDMGKWIGEKVEQIKAIPTKLKEWIDGMVDGIVNMFGDAITGTKAIAFDGAKAIAEFEQKILKAILPDPKKHTSMSDPLYWVTKAIPDSVYKVAGADIAGLDNPYKKKPITDGIPTTPEEKQAKAEAAGWKSWDDYKKSGWEWLQKPSRDDGAYLNSQGSTSNQNITIVNNNGGNVSNMNTSNVSNNNSYQDQVLSGSVLGF